MSIVRCNKCNKNIDTDFEEIEEIEGVNICLGCFIDEALE